MSFKSFQFHPQIESGIGVRLRWSGGWSQRQGPFQFVQSEGSAVLDHEVILIFLREEW